MIHSQPSETVRRFAADRRPANARRVVRRNLLRLERLEDRTVPAVSLLNGSGYAGLNFSQSSGYVPPDTSGAAGPSAYVESVNQSIELFPNKAVSTGGLRDSLSHFFFTTGGLARADSGSGLSDPVVAYDELIGRFVVGDQDVNFSTHVSAFDLAVSRTNNPTSLSAADWAFFRITTTESGYDADYPGNFGYNRDAFVFTLNMFGSEKTNEITNGIVGVPIAITCPGGGAVDQAAWPVTPDAPRISHGRVSTRHTRSTRAGASRRPVACTPCCGRPIARPSCSSSLQRCWPSWIASTTSRERDSS
jgi:hypothetical protein